MALSTQRRPRRVVALGVLECRARDVGVRPPSRRASARRPSARCRRGRDAALRPPSAVGLLRAASCGRLHAPIPDVRLAREVATADVRRRSGPAATASRVRRRAVTGGRRPRSSARRRGRRAPSFGSVQDRGARRGAPSRSGRWPSPRADAARYAGACAGSRRAAIAEVEQVAAPCSAPDQPERAAARAVQRAPPPASDAAARTARRSSSARRRGGVRRELPRPPPAVRQMRRHVRSAARSCSSTPRRTGPRPARRALSAADARQGSARAGPRPPSAEWCARSNARRDRRSSRERRARAQASPSLRRDVTPGGARRSSGALARLPPIGRARGRGRARPPTGRAWRPTRGGVEAPALAAIRRRHGRWRARSALRGRAQRRPRTGLMPRSRPVPAANGAPSSQSGGGRRPTRSAAGPTRLDVALPERVACWCTRSSASLPAPRCGSRRTRRRRRHPRATCATRPPTAAWARCRRARTLCAPAEFPDEAYFASLPGHPMLAAPGATALKLGEAADPRAHPRLAAPPRAVRRPATSSGGAGAATGGARSREPGRARRELVDGLALHNRCSRPARRARDLGRRSRLVTGRTCC